MLRNFQPDAQVNGVAATVVFGSLAALAFKNGYKVIGSASTALATLSALYSALHLPQAQGLRNRLAKVPQLSRFNLFNSNNPTATSSTTSTNSASHKPKC